MGKIYGRGRRRIPYHNHPCILVNARPPARVVLSWPNFIVKKLAEQNFNAALEMQLERLCKRGLQSHFANLNRGLEKESLRVDANGMLAQTPHPCALGAALTHPSITTDYSESLLEFVTSVHTDTAALLQELHDIHHFVHGNLRGEKLWISSMPCIVRGEDSIPIARYGNSNLALMKEAYRRGLQLRYGGLMQTIAGIHFNFSLPEEFWYEYLSGDRAQMQAEKSACYFSLIRNFHRNAWLAWYLFGASPAVCKSFLHGRAHQLKELDAHSFHLPHATSLRLSDLGYHSRAQAGLHINYNGLDKFVATLDAAIRTPRAEYQKLGVRDNGQYRQLNANWLQIENEFYAVIRPKRIAASGVSPARALAEHGVQYVEVRGVDLNPFLPLGIDAEVVRFFDLLLLYCLFTPSPPLSRDEWTRLHENHRRAVLTGRRPKLKLRGDDGEHMFAARARDLLNAMRPLAALLDEVAPQENYQTMLQTQLEKAAEPSRTPSAEILRQMRARKISFYEFAFDLAEQHADYFNQTAIPPAVAEKYRRQAAQSHRRRDELEANDKISFDEFLRRYYRRNASI